MGELNQNLYLLMHRNDIVAAVSLGTTGLIEKVNSKVNMELLPLGGRQSMEHLKKWWMKRAVPISQEGIKEILKKRKVLTPGCYLMQNLGLSLTDHYWIKPIDSDLKWENVNLYTNDFSELTGGIRLERIPDVLEVNARSSYVPSASLQGDLEKVWAINSNRERVLIKGNRSNAGQESLNEVFASQLHEQQNQMPYVKYVLVDIGKEKGKGCASVCFANEKAEYIPAIEIIESEKKRNDVSNYEFFIQKCVMNGLEEDYVRDFMDYMIMTDYVLTNTDRHLNNFGVLRDTETLKFIDMAPIFDCGKSLLVGEDISDLDNVTVNSFKTNERDMLDYVRNKAICDINKLPGRKGLAKLLDNGYMEAGRIRKICDAYVQKVGMLEQFQRDNLPKRYMHRKRSR